MTDQRVDISTDNAILLLAAAHELDLDPAVVRVEGGVFVVPDEVHSKAFDPRDEDEQKSKKTAPKKVQE